MFLIGVVCFKLVQTQVGSTKTVRLCVLFANGQGDDYQLTVLFGFAADHSVAIDAAPGGNIINRSRVGAQYLQCVARRKFFCLILGADHRYRAELAFDV